MESMMSPRNALEIVERMTAAALGNRQDHSVAIQALQVLGALVNEKELDDRAKTNGLVPASAEVVGHDAT